MNHGGPQENVLERLTLKLRPCPVARGSVLFDCAQSLVNPLTGPASAMPCFLPYILSATYVTGTSIHLDAQMKNLGTILNCFFSHLISNTESKSFWVYF